MKRKEDQDSQARYTERIMPALGVQHGRMAGYPRPALPTRSVEDQVLSNIERDAQNWQIEGLRATAKDIKLELGRTIRETDLNPQFLETLVADINTLFHRSWHLFNHKPVESEALVRPVTETFNTLDCFYHLAISAHASPDFYTWEEPQLRERLQIPPQAEHKEPFYRYLEEKSVEALRDIRQDIIVSLTNTSPPDIRQFLSDACMIFINLQSGLGSDQLEHPKYKVAQSETTLLLLLIPQQTADILTTSPVALTFEALIADPLSVDQSSISSWSQLYGKTARELQTALNTDNVNKIISYSLLLGYLYPVLNNFLATKPSFNKANQIIEYVGSRIQRTDLTNQLRTYATKQQEVVNHVLFPKQK